MSPWPALSPSTHSRSEGLSTPSPTNPFGGGEQNRRTLNQMRTGSPALSLTAGGPIGAPFGSMTYSASLPLPLSSVPAGMTLPASVSVFPQARAFTPPPSGSLPQPLLRSQRNPQMCPRWISGKRSPKKRLPRAGKCSQRGAFSFAPASLGASPGS